MSTSGAATASAEQHQADDVEFLGRRYRGDIGRRELFGGDEVAERLNIFQALPKHRPHEGEQEIGSRRRRGSSCDLDERRLDVGAEHRTPSAGKDAAPTILADAQYATFTLTAP